MRKKWISIICAVIIMVCTIITPAYAAGIFLPEESNTRQAESTDLIEAPSGILMEAQTGTVVYQTKPCQYHEDHDSDPDL